MDQTFIIDIIGWSFTPAREADAPIGSEVLVTAIFRPATLYDPPGLGQPVSGTVLVPAQMPSLSPRHRLLTLPQLEVVASGGFFVAGEQLEREFHTNKSCAPLCTVSCVHRVAVLDRLREQPLETIAELLPSDEESARRAPTSVNVLRWMFVTSRQRNLFRAAAARVLRVK